MNNSESCKKRAQQLIAEGRCPQCTAIKDNEQRVCPDCLEKERHRSWHNRHFPKRKLAPEVVASIMGLSPVKKAAPCEPPSKEELERIRNMPANCFGRLEQPAPTKRERRGSGPSSALEILKRYSAKADSSQFQVSPDQFIERFFESIHQGILAKRTKPTDATGTNDLTSVSKPL